MKKIITTNLLLIFCFLVADAQAATKRVRGRIAGDDKCLSVKVSSTDTDVACADGATGNLAVGQTSASFKVDVLSTAAGDIARFRNTAAGNGAFQIDFNGNSNLNLVNNGVKRWYLQSENSSQELRFLNSDANGNTSVFALTQAGSLSLLPSAGSLVGTNFKLGIKGQANSTANVAAIQLGDNDSSNSRQWAIVNGRNAAGANAGRLTFVVGSGASGSTDPLDGTGITAGYFNRDAAFSFGSSSDTTTGHAINGNTSAVSTIDVQQFNTTGGSSNPVMALVHRGDTDVTGAHFLALQNSSSTTIGSISGATNTTVAFNTSSDKRLKQNPTDFSGLSMVDKMRPRQYEWKSKPGVRNHGFYAQELYEVLPEAVTVGNDRKTESGELANPWAVDYSKLTPVLVKAVQELSKRNADLEARINFLEKQITKE